MSKNKRNICMVFGIYFLSGYAAKIALNINPVVLTTIPRIHFVFAVNLYSKKYCIWYYICKSNVSKQLLSECTSNQNINFKPTDNKIIRKHVIELVSVLIQTNICFSHV